MLTEEIEFASYNGRDIVKGWTYLPDSEPKAVLQLIHGLGCHSRRYKHMISTLLAAGFAVFADDHVGHGKTALDSGNFADPGDRGFWCFVEDEKTLHDLASRRFPQLPYIMFGHSMGSMIARAYAMNFGEELSALALGGILQNSAAHSELSADTTIKAQIDAGNGKSMYLGNVYSEKIAKIINERYAHEMRTSWLSSDAGVLAEYISDPLNLNSGYSLNMVFSFLELYKYTTAEGWAERIPRSLPVFVFAGDCDPCCNYGEGLYYAANELIRSGHNTKQRVYYGYRHEVHNNPLIRNEVEQELVDFCLCQSRAISG